jgi:hypothetical protein
MYRDIRMWMNSCELCAKRKPYQPTNHGLLQPIQATYPFEVVGIDIVGPFSRSKKGNKYILVCVDLFTNWIELAPMKTICAEEVSELVFIEHHNTSWMPNSHSDRPRHTVHVGYVPRSV